MKLISVTPENIEEQTLFCIKDLTNKGFKNKKDWFLKRYQEGLRLKILRDDQGKPISFIEYIPAEFAWRPVDAPGYLFIHCMVTYSKSDRRLGHGKTLLESCAAEAKSLGLLGVAVMTSRGAWITDRGLFEKNGYTEVDKRGRFDLLALKFNSKSPDPKLMNWEKDHPLYQGWHLVYADQCPWHEKAINELDRTAQDHDINIVVHKIQSAKEAKAAPSGFGVFSLLHNGRLLEDHYISVTRFKNILEKELAVSQ